AGSLMTHPRSAFGAPPQGGDTSGPAKPDPRCPHEGSATELARALASRELSSVELLHALLGRIERLNPALNAIVTLDAERALRRASEADDALARGHSWGPLHGVPFTLKDCFATAGLRTNAGHPPLADHVPRTDSTVAR